MDIKNLSDSNEYIINKIKQNIPFLIARCGIGCETGISADFKAKKKVNKQYLYGLANNSGIYCDSITNAEEFCKKYIECIEKCDALAVWNNAMINQQKILKPTKTPSIHTRVLEPFYICSEQMVPWSHYLLGKKVLVINPFTSSMQKQLSNNFKIFSDDRRLFLEGQEFVFYRSFVTSAGNHTIHKNWKETFSIMCEDISKLEFDIALLGCGGYGLPLSYYIHNSLNKSAIYVGGGLQMMFGVMGARWDNTEYWSKIKNEHNPAFIRPSGDEITLNKDRVENGCYW